MTPVLVGLDAAGSADAWRAAGFAVEHDTVTIGRVRVDVGGAGRGIAGWTFTGIDAATSDIDGLRTRAAERSVDASGPAHPNGVTLIDHVVVWSPDSDRTVAALTACGFEAKRVREDARPGFRQTFFRAGEVIVELVAPAALDDADRPLDDAPARFFGLACTVRDLEACAARLGDALGPIKPAVQPGRTIATLRTRDLGLDVAIAFMSEAPR
jgi:hypothetical protein